MNTSNPPLFPNQDLPARNLWPVIEGRQLLQAVLAQPVQRIELFPGTWQITHEQWQLYSASDDVFATEHTVRQHFFQVVQTEQEFTDYFSIPRCLAIMETGENEQWRLWQIIKTQNSLAQLLDKSLAQDPAKKVAAMLFIVADKFVAAHKLFSQLGINLNLNLDNLGLVNNKTLFIGFIPRDFRENALVPIPKCLENSLKKTATKIINHPNLSASQVLDYLKIYATDNAEQKIVVEIFAKLLAESL